MTRTARHIRAANRRAQTQMEGLHRIGSEELLAAFHEDLRDVDVMDHRESRRLCALAQAGDLAARNAVIAGNLRLVEWVATKYATAGLPLVDLIGEGTLGLVRAVEKYNAAGRWRFSTYATRWIQSTIQRALISDRLVHIPYYVVEHKAAIGRGTADGIQQRASEENLAAAARFSYVRSLDAEVEPESGVLGAGNEGTRLGDLVADPLPLPVERVVADEESDELHALLRRVLTKREWRLIALRYGLDGATDEAGKPGRTLEVVGELLGITRERVRQIEAHAILKLRLRLEQDDDGGVRLRRALSEMVSAAAA